MYLYIHNYVFWYATLTCHVVYICCVYYILCIYLCNVIVVSMRTITAL